MKNLKWPIFKFFYGSDTGVFINLYYIVIYNFKNGASNVIKLKNCI